MKFPLKNQSTHQLMSASLLYSAVCCKALVYGCAEKCRRYCLDDVPRYKWQRDCHEGASYVKAVVQTHHQNSAQMLYGYPHQNCNGRVPEKIRPFALEQTHKHHCKQKSEIISSRNTEKLARSADTARKHRQANKSHKQISAYCCRTLPRREHQCHKADYDCHQAETRRWQGNDNIRHCNEQTYQQSRLGNDIDLFISHIRVSPILRNAQRVSHIPHS